MMNTGEDEPSSGLNGRLRPRKSNIPSPNSAKSTRKPDTKPALDKPKTSTPSKASPNKPDDLTDKSDSIDTQLLCPYCDNTFFDKQAVSKHVHRVHFSTNKQDNISNCLFCNHVANDADNLIRHMVDNHPNQYFACYECHTRFPSTADLAEHKLNVCEKQKLPYRNKLRQKSTPKNTQNITFNSRTDFESEVKHFPEEHDGFNGIVISCELKSSTAHDLTDIEDNITTNFILPSSKNLVNGTVIEKNAVIILDDLQWNKRVAPNFAFQSTDADQILSRLGVVHRSPRTGDSNNKEFWSRCPEDPHQKFEKCFDTGFYTKVASNVHENLSKYLDGSCNFNPDPENTIKTRKAKNIVAINTVEGFPILLACQQFSRNGFDGYMPRAVAPRHKWKWDNAGNDRSLMTLEQMKRDSHTNNCIITLVSSLDIWTQLCMRRKFEIKFTKSVVQKKTEKQNIIGNQLKEILESRELPASSSQIVKYTAPIAQTRRDAEFPASLGLVPSAPSFDLKPAVLSGEWVRPRCYVCCACGAQTRDPKGLSSHISTQHPNAQIQHYEIVGEVLLNSDILKHLYVPPSQVNNRTRPLRGIRECTKCQKSISLEDLHQHMLDCAGDTPAVRRKCRYRPFGVRKRRPRLPDNTIRKNMRKDIRSRHARKTHMRPRPRIRTEVGDAETIRKMLADLPAKRHRVMVKPLNTIIRPRRKLIRTKNKLIMKKRVTEDTKNSQEDSSVTSLGTERSKKSSCDSEDRPPKRGIKKTVKCVASKLLRKTNSLHKKMVNKSRDKILKKDIKFKTVLSKEEKASSSGGDGIPIEQFSLENNTQKINVNQESCNSREHGEHSNNNNNNSYNRDNQSPESNNDQNGNSRDFNAPSQGIPLKHSIASLTANTETQDKSVQFHHSFLIQQECNNLTQNLPASQKMLFENEAVVTKLDKPPLHFNPRRPLDLYDIQNKQANKLNKPRKGLNDCITMLRNKLVEPDSVPGHVSVQCGNDEPLNPEPVIVERRHSTTELISDFPQRSDYLNMYTPKTTSEENTHHANKKSRSRRSSTRQPSVPRSSGHNSRNEKTTDILFSNELLQWKHYFDTQMMAAHNAAETFSKRGTPRRRSSLVPTDELLLQHAINLELLSQTNKDLTNFTAFHNYPNIQNLQHTVKKNNRRDSRKSKANTNTQSTRSKTKDNSTIGVTKRSCRSKTAANSNSKRNSVKNTKRGQLRCSTESRVENFVDPYLQKINDMSANYNTGIESYLINKPTDEIQLQNVSHNIPIVEYTNNSDTLLVRHGAYTINQETMPISPLDLSNKITNSEEVVQYVTPEDFSAAPYETYETLDLSNRNFDTLPARETQNEDDIVDLRIGYTSSFQSRYTPLPPELVCDEAQEDNATDLSVRCDDNVPTDLSINNRNYCTSFEETGESHNHSRINYIQDFNPTRHGEDNRIIVHEFFDESSDKIVVVDNEEPPYLSSRSASRSNLYLLEEQMHLNEYPENMEAIGGNLPADLSGQNIEASQFMGPSGSFNSPLINYENYDAQRPPHGLNVDQIHNFYYNPSIGPPPDTNYTRSSNRTSIAYCEANEQFDPRTITTVAASATCDLSINKTSLNNTTNYEQIDYSISEMPLSLVSNSPAENTGGLCKSTTKATEYGMGATLYTLANDSVSVTNSEPTITSAVISTDLNKSLINTDVDTANKATANDTCNNTIPTNTKNSSNTQTSSFIEESESKRVQASNTLSSTSNSEIETEKINVEVDNVSNSNPTNSDNDPETARKIAMLPKELVEILGTMPIDHRNQLLNVLPQYVSTSTSPLSLSNINENARCNSDCLPANTKTVNRVGQELKLETTCEEGLMNNTSNTFQFSESTPISVSSSILLTPPTPQMSERYSLQPQENSEIKSRNKTSKARASIENEIPPNCSDSDKLAADQNVLGMKRTNTVEYNMQDQIIDLTGDENSLEKPDVNNVESVIHTHLIPMPTNDTSATPLISKPNFQQTSSDKTASLRAVRIKTPSERHRSMLVEKELVRKKQNDGTTNIMEQNDSDKDTSNISPMAIQQAEVSSTQHRSVQRTTQMPTESLTEDLKKTVNETIVVKKDNTTVLDKPNLVTSSFLKMKFETDTDSVVCKDNTNAKSTVINVSSSEKPNTATHMNDNIEINRIDVSVHDDFVTSKDQPSVLSKSKELSLLDDDDSEDDITLAVIVKQKLRDSNFAAAPADLHHTTVDVGNKQKTNNKKKRKSKKNNRSNQDSCSKYSAEDNIGFSSDKNLAIDIISESVPTYKDRLCDENNLNNTTVHCKKNIKKVQLVTNPLTTKCTEKNDSISNTRYENEINKENNSSSDKAENTESVTESFKSKPFEQDTNLPSSVSKVASRDCNNKESTLNMDPAHTNLGLNIECGQSTVEVIDITNDTEVQNLCEKDSELAPISPCIVKSLPTKSQDSNEAKKILSIVDTSENGTSEGDLSKIEKSRVVFNVEKSETNDKVNSDAIVEIEEINLTPLRRSRRGKSLFVDSHSTILDKPVLQDNPNEQRAPLTKKQLIFSKLLDEEKHSKISLSNTPILVEEIKNKSSSIILLPDEEEKNIHSNSFLKTQEDKSSTQINTLPEYDASVVDKTNKRKISPQSKKKTKKKKSLGNQNIAEVIDIQFQENKNNEVFAHNYTIPEISSHDKVCNKEVSETITGSVSSVLSTLDAIDTIPKLTLSEKRKSGSPTRSDSSHTSKPKKSKLNDTSESNVNGLVGDENEEMKVFELKTFEDNKNPTIATITTSKNTTTATSNTTTTTTTRNTTCYNKPVRRARSKSVVVKSSATEFYDPYDINLEDMRDKTEPFVRKEIPSKICFNSLKSSIAAKTRKLSKTAPSAIIDISPSECVDLTGIEEDSLIVDKGESLNNTKDGNSDSDESTKSDVPLKVYAEDKERKLAQITPSTDKQLDNNTNTFNEKLRDKIKLRKKDTRNVCMNKDETKTNNDIEDSEKDLRSEQFMESFGFFSEKKPRKSNLLATKKISETFHIIANDNDDVYFGSKERFNKKGPTENRKDDTKSSKGSSSLPMRRSTKRGRKEEEKRRKTGKKTSSPIESRFCNTCEDNWPSLEKHTGDKSVIKIDGEIDSLTAKNIFESKEVLNFVEKTEVPTIEPDEEKMANLEAAEESIAIKSKIPEFKEKMYPDVLENIDMFEDKFDKIKRKCRSQAAAAKQIQTQVDTNPSFKNRRKSDKKKGKKISKKCQNVVPTKGALKGFDGTKDSVLTSDFNIHAIGPTVGQPHKKKKKKRNNSKKKRERQTSDPSNKSDSDQATKETSQKKVDVYEFLDTEDTELFELRPSNLLERMKVIQNKDLPTPSTSKDQPEEPTHSSSESVSDGDDFVYMDDLAFSEDETENSVLSCELGSGKGNNDPKKTSPVKRKDVIEKNAVMGKIFKNNAVRSDKKSTKPVAKPTQDKANLDQLFDSLLEKETTETKDQTEVTVLPEEVPSCSNTYCSSIFKKDTTPPKFDFSTIIVPRKIQPSTSVTPIILEPLIAKIQGRQDTPKEHPPLTQMSRYETQFNKFSEMDAARENYTSKFHNSLNLSDEYSFTKQKSKEKMVSDKPSTSNAKRKIEEECGGKAYRSETPERMISFEDAGVARQRARRKCTVGKQNVLAESWSSESEPDAAPPRPNSAESVVGGSSRRKKSRRREGQAPAVRKPARPRTRPPPLYWAEGPSLLQQSEDHSDEEVAARVQQHGWIVGDSHKKLVTMLAHAKGRKRANDDAPQMLE